MRGDWCRRSLHLRDELERAVALEADDGEVPAVEREKRADILTLGEMRQDGIGQFQAGILVAFHPGHDGGQVVGIERGQGEESAGEAVEELVKRVGPLA